MKNVVGAIVLTVAGWVNAGAVVVVNLNDGREFKWQFEEMVEAEEFLADRIAEGRCSPMVVSVTIRSEYIAGLDDEEDGFAWYHGFKKAY